MWYLINSQVLDFLSPNLSENERNKADKKPRNRNSKTSPKSELNLNAKDMD